MSRQRVLLAFFLGLMLAFVTRAFVTGDAGIDGEANAIRAQQGLPPIATSALLTDIAQQRAYQIVTDFSHTYWWWDASGCRGIGENLAWTMATDEAWPIRAWVASPSHYANMLGDWDLMGSAEIVVGGNRYAVQLFGKDCVTSPPESGADQQTPPPTPVPVQNPPIWQPPQPTVVPAPVHLPDTSMEKP